MSKKKKIIARYATVFLAHAIQSDALKSISSSVSSLQNQFKAHPTLDSVLHNPTIPCSEKRKLLEKLCKCELHPILWRFLEVIMDQRQIGLLKEILISFSVAYHDYIGIQSAVLTTAVSLPDALTKRLIEKVKQLVTCKEVLLEQQIDPSIIGGYILQIGDLKLDRSVKHYLRALQSCLH